MSKLWIKAGIACAILAAILVWAFSRRPHALEARDRIPNFTLQRVNSGSMTLPTAGNHVVLVNFWATWCPPCVMETPSLEKFAHQMRPLGVQVVGVSVDQNLPDLEKFISGYQLTYPILRDPYQKIAFRFGTHIFPETYIFDRDGRLADKIIGAADWEDPHMIRFVEALVHWPPPNVSGEQKAATGNY